MYSRFTPRVIAYAAAAAILHTLAFVGIAAAVPVNYSETVSGDLPDGFSAGQTTFPILPFDVGTNTVSGRYGDTGTVADFDGFAFNVPVGMQVTSGTLVLTDAQGNMGGAEWYLNPGTAPNFSVTPYESLAAESPGSDSLALVPLSSGGWSMTTNGFFYGTAPVSGDYVFTFVVVVPEPATATATASLTLAAIAIRRRPRRN